MVTSTGTGCQIEFGSASLPQGRFDACIGVAGPNSDRLDVRLPGGVPMFGDATRDEVSAPMVQAALSLSFREWLAGRA